MSAPAAVTTAGALPRRHAVRGHRIVGPAATVLMCTLAVKLIATGKEFVVAGVFGRSDALDAYLAALLVPALIINLVAESMSQALVPELVRVRVQRGIDAAAELVAVSLTRLCALLLAVCAAAALSAAWWVRCVGWNFPTAKLSLTLHLFYGLLPSV